MRINIVEILDSLNKAQGVILPKLGLHQRQVAYLAYRLAEQLNQPQELKNRLFVTGLLHDIGALSVEEKLDAFSEINENINIHSFRGAYMISKFLPYRNISPIVYYHHFPWRNGATITEYPEMPMESQLIYLADRICVNITGTGTILSQLPQLRQYAKENSGEEFYPEYVAAFLELSNSESLWLDIISSDPIAKIDYSYIANIDMSIDDLIDLARCYSYLIDFRSTFTATHSAGVAKTAQTLAELMFFSPDECKKMLIAGYLHDLGKLAVDNNILEKQAPLTAKEIEVIRSHTYYTYYLLDGIAVFEEIKKWAAYHHEKLSGEGYPFHLKDENICLGARIMAVSDVFSALLEKRPYKEPFSKEKSSSILLSMAKNRSLDANVVDVLLDNYDKLSYECINAEKEAREDYDILYSIS